MPKLSANTTWHLVADMERIRRDLAIADWIAFGGHLGPTLSLIYRQTLRTDGCLVLAGYFDAPSELDCSRAWAGTLAGTLDR